MNSVKVMRWTGLAALLMLAIMGLLSIKTASAACTANADVLPMPAQHFNIPSYGLTVGQAIGDWVYASTPYVSNCPEQIYSISGFNYKSLAGMTYVDAGISYNVFNTGTPGVGFIIALKPSAASSYLSVPAVTPYVVLENNGTPRGLSMTMDLKIKFIATAPLSMGIINVAQMTATAGYVFNNAGATIGQAFSLISGYTITVTANTCNVAVGSANQMVTLDNVVGNDLPAVGSTAKDKTFNVLLSCQTDVQIYAQMNGTPNPDTAADGVLEVSYAGMPGTSSGVGIQILNGSTPMPIGTNMLVKMTPGGQEIIPFTARYYRTLQNMTAGTANAIATLNINYQ
jgi:type 1 fimbria pilin